MVANNLVKFLEDVENSGFVSWLDGEWPTTLGNKLSKYLGNVPFKQ
jgi:hypothetical protein